MDGWSANKTDCDQMTSGLRVTWDKKAFRNSTAHLFPLLDDLDGKQQIGAHQEAGDQRREVVQPDVSPQSDGSAHLVHGRLLRCSRSAREKSSFLCSGSGFLLAARLAKSVLQSEIAL